MLTNQGLEGLDWLFYVYLGIMVALIPLFITSGVLSIVSIFKGKENPSKIVMICKLALIPWYILNFAMCFCLIGGMLNPFLFLAIPIVIAIMVSSTYLYMIFMSAPDICYFLHQIIKEKKKPDALTIISIVMLFIFCLDPVGGVIYYIKTK